MYHVKSIHPAVSSGTQQPITLAELAKRMEEMRICNIVAKDMMLIITQII